MPHDDAPPPTGQCLLHVGMQPVDVPHDKCKANDGFVWQDLDKTCYTNFGYACMQTYVDPVTKEQKVVGTLNCCKGDDCGFKTCKKPTCETTALCNKDLLHPADYTGLFVDHQATPKCNASYRTEDGRCWDWQTKKLQPCNAQNKSFSFFKLRDKQPSYGPRDPNAPPCTQSLLDAFGYHGTRPA